MLSTLLFIILSFQCPYYIDGNVKLSQSFAIMKYLGRKHDLFPKTEEEMIRVDLVEGEALDLRLNYVLLCYCISGDYVRSSRFKWFFCTFSQII